MANSLPVNFTPQLLTGALEHANDCGSASSLMLLKTYNLAITVTVDQFFNSIESSGDVGLSVGAMQAKMAEYGLKNEWKVGMTRGDVFTYLSNKKPVLTLVHYAPLVDAKLTEKIGFRGAHYVVIRGTDLDTYFINDPYRDDGKENIVIPISTFELAWSQANLDGNPTCGGIMPLLSIQDLLTTVPIGDEYLIISTVNGLNVRSQPSETSTLIKTIWRTIIPSVHILASTLVNGYVRLSDGTGWVWFAYLTPKK